MRAGAVILGICISAILLAVAVALYLLADNNSGQHYRRSVDLVRQIQLASSDWSMEITRVKANPFADFDSLAAFIPRMARLKDNLSDTAQRIGGMPDRLSSDIQAYLSAIEAKEERIERFKTGYAVVRNSRRYLPLAATNVLRQAQNADNDALVRDISGLIRDVNLYLATPTETSQARLTTEIESLREASVSYAPGLANALANLFSHAEVLVSKQGPTEKLYSSATSNDISDLTAQLTGALEFELGKQKILATYYNRGSVAAIAAMIAFWILLAVQQRLSGRAVAPRVASRPAAIEVEPAPAAAAAAEEPAAAAEPEAPAPAPAAPAPAPAVEPAPLRLPAGPALADADSPLRQGFVVSSLAETLAASAEEIAGRMDYLRRTQQRIQDAVRSGGGFALDGTDMDEEIEAIAAIAVSVRQRMNGIADLAKRLDALPNGLAQGIDRGMIDLNACVETVVQAAEAAGGAIIVRNLGELPEIFASKDEFEMLLAEIVENSMAAVRGHEDGKGMIKIDTVRKNDEILITVIDNGDGIAPDKRMNVFKPLYTSRDGSMGIGLALARHLAKSYGGEIKLNSLLGQGTAVRIVLPAGISGP